MGETNRFNDIIIDAMQSKGIDIDELSSKTNIMPAYAKALIERNFNKLPAQPYIRGYLKSISEILDIDFDSLWKKFLLEERTKKSGKTDIMPSNRFESKSISKKTIITIIIAMLAFVLIIQFMPSFIGRPSLKIIFPKNNIVKTSSNRYAIKGEIQNKQDKVSINGNNVVVDNNGSFTKEVYLENGMNSFHITAKRLLGKSVSLDKTIIYTPQQTNKQTKSTTTSTSTIKNGSSN